MPVVRSVWMYCKQVGKKVVSVGLSVFTNGILYCSPFWFPAHVIRSCMEQVVEGMPMPIWQRKAHQGLLIALLLRMKSGKSDACRLDTVLQAVGKLAHLALLMQQFCQLFNVHSGLFPTLLEATVVCEFLLSDLKGVLLADNGISKLCDTLVSKFETGYVDPERLPTCEPAFAYSEADFPALLGYLDTSFKRGQAYALMKAIQQDILGVLAGFEL